MPSESHDESDGRRWRDIFAHTSWGIVIGSKDGKLIEAANPAFARMHGWTVDELTGRPILDLFPPSEHARIPSEILCAHERGRHRFESVHVRKDGSTFPVAVDVTTVKDDRGEVLCRTVHVEDLTEQKRWEATLRTANIFRDVLDRLLEGCQVVSFDYRYLYLNNETEKQARRPRSELIGRTMMECYPGIETTEMFTLLRRSMVERTHEQMENVFEFPDGTLIAFELRFVPVPDGVCILSLDITERRHRLAAIVNDSDDAIVGTTLEGVVTSWNRSAERIFGYTAEEMIGRQVEATLMPSLTENKARLAQIKTGQRVDHFETTAVRKGGGRLEVSLTMSPIRDYAGKLIGVSKIIRDVTETRAIQREITRAKEALEVANKELESFSYSVAHDLRAPLRSIDGFAQALLEDYGSALAGDGSRYLSYVRESAQLMAQLIDDILTLSRVTRAELSSERIDLSELARVAEANMLRTHRHRAVEVTIQDGLWAEGDPRLLAVVFDNLFSNAWKFTSKCPHARVEFGATRRDGELYYFVRDNGAGFDMTYVGKLFGAFQRLHPASEFEGTGVGLATVQRIIHRHSGKVLAEGAVREGATFYFTLPEKRGM